jgi:hypothetical protein
VIQLLLEVLEMMAGEKEARKILAIPPPTLSEYGRQIDRSVTTLSNLARRWEDSLADGGQASRMTSRLEERLDVPPG